MRSEALNNYLRSNGIGTFTIYDAAKIMSKPVSYASKFLANDGYVKRVERGIYYTKDATEYEVASRILFPSYISLVSALRFYNLTEQIPHVIFVVSPKRHRPIPDLEGMEVQFRVIKRPMLYGYGKVEDVFVADPEKAVVDMLYLNSFVEYAEEAVERGKVDVAKLVDYAKRSRVMSVIKKTEGMVNAEDRT